MPQEGNSNNREVPVHLRIKALFHNWYSLCDQDINAGSILGFESAVELRVVHTSNRIQQTHQSPGAKKIFKTP